jgi:hypothetical protein
MVTVVVPAGPLLGLTPVTAGITWHVGADELKRCVAKT